MDLTITVTVLLLVAEGALALWLLLRAGLLPTGRTLAVSALLIAGALGLRFAFFDYRTLDYINFLSRWVQFFRDYDGFRALRYEIGNYNIPYLYFLALFSRLPMDDLYLIKLLSTLSDILLAWGAALFCRRFAPKSTARLLGVFFTVLFLPTVWLNSAVWGQCDSLYAAPLVLAVVCAMEEKPWHAMVLAAVAFGFKLQAVFVLPIFAVFLMTGKLSWKHLIAFPLTYLILVLPAVIMGRPLWETVTLYFHQTGSIGDGLNYNSPSVFSVFTNIEDKEAAATAGIVLAFLYMLNLLAVAFANRKKLNDKAILALCLLFAIGIPFLLPHMHERYFFCADIFSVILAFSFPVFSPAALLVQFASLLGYHAYLKMRYLLLMNNGAAALVVAFMLAILCLIQALREAGAKPGRRGRPRASRASSSGGHSAAARSSGGRSRSSSRGRAGTGRRFTWGALLPVSLVGMALAAVCLMPPALAQEASPQEPAARVSDANASDAKSPAGGMETAVSAEHPVSPATGSAGQAEKGSIRITELMIRNHTTLRDAGGNFSDWIELHNESGEDIVLEGWSISDRDRRPGLVFPAFLFPADSYCVVYATGLEDASTMQAPFALSAGETVYLKSPEGKVISSAVCEDLQADRSQCMEPDGAWRECLYPTPGAENTTAAYDRLQETLTISSPVILNEAMVSDPNGTLTGYGGSDWVELKNISSAPVSLRGYYLSDDDDLLLKCPLPEVTLEPGEISVFRCDTLGFALSAENEALFLAREEARPDDWLFLRDIPYGGSYDRMTGRNGAFFFPKASPGEENADGARRVSATPAALSPDGVFDTAEEAVLNLQAGGEIRYTFDATLPTRDSILWTGPAKVPATAVIRAVSFEDGALPSRPLTLTYLIGENHSLPVASLVTDNATAFWKMWDTQLKDTELTGNLAFYDEAGGFSAGCGISLHGDTSLILPKKGLDIRFRNVYDRNPLQYDLFGGGVTEFSNLLLRAGQDQDHAIIRNELCENLALKASPWVVASRSRYCVLYINGRYAGIYSLCEKMNRQHYANLAGVSKESVTTVTGNALKDSALYRDVIAFCETHDMSDEKNFAHIRTVLDLDSLIDWVFLEGFFANTDLTYGNYRWCQSTEDDGRWRLMFYDLDATLSSATANHGILLKRNDVQCTQMSYIVSDLLENQEFRDRFLTRAAELLGGPLSDDAVLSEIDRLGDEIRAEVPRDRDGSSASWENAMSALRRFIGKESWTAHNIDALTRELRLTPEEREAYFGGLEQASDAKNAE
ncbi:MAG: CotH kinase family protein [Oscillospiraceae bacterium]|nr:CotH kinase family protein [Oscillospiraceae bacterium]